MLFRTSSILFLAIVFVAAFYQANCLEIKGLVDKYVIYPTQSMIPEKEHSDGVKEEHGSFDSLGRDIIRGASKKISEIQEDLKARFSKSSKGLDCDKTLSNEKVDNFKSRVRAIYPGTKWCGDGNISRSFDDLGKFSQTDRCCREHDMCPDNMAAYATKYDLVNTGLFTRSHCDCDRKFYDCLKESKNLIAQSIGFTYFTVLGPQCFKQDYPIVECREQKKGKCIKYVTDQRGEKLYQWFDSPTF